MKGEHLKKQITLKNWKTKRNLTCQSGTEFSKKYNLPIQVVCDIRNGRRKTYGNFSLPNLAENQYFKCAFKNLKTGKTYKFRKFNTAAKQFRISPGTLKRLATESGFRHKHFAHLDFHSYSSIPVIKHSNGKKTKIYSISDYIGGSGTNKYRSFYFSLKQARITGKHGFKVIGVKDYKYTILDNKTGRFHRAHSLKDFAAKNNLDNSSVLYKLNDRFKVIEG